MEKIFSKILLILIFFTFLSIASPIFAAVVCPGTPCLVGEICIENPLCAQTLAELIGAIANFIFWVATALVPLMIVIGAFYFLTSAGNPRQIETAKTIILYTLIGWGILLLANSLITIIKEILTVP